MDLSRLDTEKRNTNTENIDRVSTENIIKLINNEDKLVAPAVEKEIPNIAKAVDEIYKRVLLGGRLIYIGCGTSGRLGVLDASECPPTFGVKAGLVVGVIAGGEKALTTAIEGLEDDPKLSVEDLKKINFSSKDALVGLAASGRTPYVLGALEYAKQIGAAAIGLCCSANSKMSEIADITIAPLPGPEALTGSTRMKSGTAQKMVLNMLSTALMIKLGKVYKNLMVDVMATNQKLKARAINIVKTVTGVDDNTAALALEKSQGSCKTAIVSILLNLSAEEAEKAIQKADGHLNRIIE
ncbi:MAG: N-acetylmuramic acid 6-phosphate etherase [Eubacteriales bacterium]|nr:N-acetylmuramic acid 6-phosphate etherase [Eubacteriales bacterium]